MLCVCECDDMLSLKHCVVWNYWLLLDHVCHRDRMSYYLLSWQSIKEIRKCLQQIECTFCCHNKTCLIMNVINRKWLELILCVN